VMGILAIVLAIALPALSSARTNARLTKSLSNVRQIGSMVVAYANDYDDKPPAMFPPEYIVIPRDPPLEVDFGGFSFRGSWFSNHTFGQYLLAPPPPTDVARAPGAQDIAPFIVGGSATSHFLDYLIADTLYARPKYWDRQTQAGPTQWGLQRITSTRYPSDKGLMIQSVSYDVPGEFDRYPTCCVDDVRSAVLWTDLSASIEIQARLIPGVPNFYYCCNGGPQAVWSVGAPVRCTQDGILGRDR